MLGPKQVNGVPTEYLPTQFKTLQTKHKLVGLMVKRSILRLYSVLFTQLTDKILKSIAGKNIQGNKKI